MLYPGPRRFGRQLQNLPAQALTARPPTPAHPYSEQILKYLFSQEASFCISQSIAQPHVNSSMRAVLVDWLVLLSQKLQLRPETLYLTCHLLDVILSSTVIERRQLQLLGVSALFVACKQEEIHPPAAKDLCAVCQNSNSLSSLHRS